MRTAPAQNKKHKNQDAHAVPFGGPVKQIQQQLDSHESDEPLALDYLKLLNLSGLEVKGQLSTALGQAGIGLSLSVGVDFGALLVPFVHLQLGTNIDAQGTADGLLMLHRLPHRLWRDAILKPQQPPPPQQAPPDSAPAKLRPPFPEPYWSSRTPLGLAFLRGKTFRLKAGVFARAWAGAGAFDDLDETGVTIGIGLAADASATVARLLDPAVHHYPANPDDKGLGDAVNDLFADNLKAKAAAWLVGTGGGVGNLETLGAPQRTRRQQLEDAGVDLGKVALDLCAKYDELTIPDVDSLSGAGIGVTVLKSLRGIGRRIQSAVNGDKLGTDVLLTELANAQRELTGWRKMLAEDSAKAVYGNRLCAQLTTLTERRLQQAETLRRALQRRKAAEPTKLAWLPHNKQAVVAGRPGFSLDITALEANSSATASARLVLPRDAVSLRLAAGAQARLRRNLFRYQAWAPGPPARTLRWTQDTVVTYVTRQFTASGQAASRATGRSGFSKKWPNLVTMSYRSALAQWFARARGMPDSGLAIPNGSGVSFGMSVLPQSLANYVRCCKYAKDDPTNPGAVMDEGLKALEAALTKQLRVGVDDLRKFMRNAPSSLADVPLDRDSNQRIESYLVESAFAVTAPLPLQFDPKAGADAPPQDLFDLTAVKTLIGTGVPDAALRLQSIRLRYRIHTSTERGASLIQLGWNPEPWGEDASGATDDDDARSWLERVTGFDPSLPDWLKMSSLAVELGIEIQSIRRADCTGTVDLHTQLYPDPYSHAPSPDGYGRNLARQYEVQNWRELTDMLVPPVALFGQ